MSPHAFNDASTYRALRAQVVRLSTLLRLGIPAFFVSISWLNFVDLTHRHLESFSKKRIFGYLGHFHNGYLLQSTHEGS